MTVVANLVAKITADAEGFERGIGKATGALNGLKGLLPAVTVGGVAAFVKSTIDAADEMRDFGIVTGTSTEFLSQMQHVTDLLGVDFNRFVDALSRSQNSMKEIARSDKAVQQMAEMGINVREILQLNPEQQFLALADAIKNIKDPAARTNAAMKLFGRTGADLIKIFAVGADEINNMRSEADALGLTIGQEAADSADRANDAITRLTGAFLGLGRTLALEFSGPLADAVELLSRGLPIVGNTVSAAVKSIGQVIGGVGAANAQVLQGNVSGGFGILADIPRDVAGNFDGLLNENRSQTDVLKSIDRNLARGTPAVAQ